MWLAVGRMNGNALERRSRSYDRNKLELYVRFVFDVLEVVAWTGLIWLWIRTSVGLLRAR